MRARCSPILVVLAILLPASSAYSGPETTGDYVTGAHDFDFVDTQYPSDFAFDEGGRRIKARAYYPVCLKSDVTQDTNRTTASCNGEPLGRLREYFEPGEWEVTFGEAEPTNLTDFWNLTHSYLDAVPMAGAFPVVVYTHGFGMFFTDNTALLEEIASHGYICFAVGSPGFGSGLEFEDGEVVSGLDYPEILEAMPTPPNASELNATMAAVERNVSDPFLPPHYSDDVGARYQEMEDFILGNATDMTALNLRVRDDQLALADYLEEVRRSDGDELIAQIMKSSVGVDEIVCMGFSFGGAASASSAQVDDRVVGAINIDGMQYSTNLFATPIRTPLLTFDGQAGFVPFYYNEFFYEPLETMGSRSDITRVGFVEPGIMHLDFSDLRHIDPMFRQLMGMNHTVDGQGLYDVLSDFTLGFLDTTLKNQDSWDPNESFAKFAETEPIDVSHVADWASGREEELPSFGGPLEQSDDEKPLELDATVAVDKQAPNEDAKAESLETSSAKRVMKLQYAWGASALLLAAFL